MAGTDHRRRAERWYRRLLLFYPAEFRRRFETDLIELFADLHERQAAGDRRRFWRRVVRDTIVHGLTERLTRSPRRLPLRVHHVKGASAMSLLFEDLRHAVRAVRRQPALSSVLVLTLALAIGANSAIFTVVNAVLLRPLPFADPGRVVMLYEVDPRGRDSLASLDGFRDWQRELKTITGLSLMGAQSVNLTGVAEPDRLRGGFVTAAFFDMLGVRPIVGRAFAAGEDLPGAPKTAILDYATWQTRFGGDPSIVGRALILNNEPHQIIGILPPSFEFPIDAVNVWMPQSSSPIQDPRRSSRNHMVIGRVRADVTFEQALAELRQVAGSIAAAYPATNGNWTARFEPFHDVTVRLVSTNLKLLAGAVALVLLIACANIANLLLARSGVRQREMAVRTALGASRARLVRQLLTESVLVASAGGTLGLLLGAALTDVMLTLLPVLPRADRVAPDATVVAFTAALSLLTGLLFGTLPALRTSRPDLRSTLNEGGRGGESRSAGRMRSALIVAELALSLVLLIGAGLFLQSLARLTSVEIGYDPKNLLTLEYRLPRNKYSSPEQRWEFHGRALQAIAAVPGVQTAALASAIPQSGNGGYVGFWRSEDSQPAEDVMPRAQYNTVTSEYFRAMGIPILAGRVCNEQDTADRPLTLIVNQLMAERMWPGDNAVGKRLRAPDFPGEAVVVGVVGNTRPMLLSMPMASQIYGCFSQQPGIFASVVAKTAGDPMAAARAVQQAIWSVDADQPMWKIRSAETLLSGSVQTQRFVMLLMMFAAGLALLLAALGTYSVLSYTVQRRAREVGVRMALGATRGHVARLVLGQTTVLIAAGVGIGLAGAYALTQVLTVQLYEVSPRDPLTFAATAVTLSAVALLAAWMPTRRATALDPVVTLRAE